MATTKPTGPYKLAITAETTPFTFEAWTLATDFFRHLTVTFGDSVRPREEIDESRCDRGAFAEVLGDYPEVPWSIEARFWGRGAAGTALAPRKALMESAAGLSEVVVGSTSVTYESDSANPASSASMYRVDRNALLGEYLIGCICQQIVIDLTKTEAPKITYSGVAARKWEFMADSIADVGGISDVDTTMTLTNPKRLRTGTNATTESGLEIYVKAESEIIKITAMNWTSGVATIERGLYGTSGAAHLQNVVLTPYAETPTFNESAVIGPHDWTVSDGAAVNIRSLQYTLETGRMFDELQTGSASRDALHNRHIKGTGQMVYILNQERFEYGRDMDAGTELDLAVTLGTVAGDIHTINLDHVRLVDPVPKDAPYNEVVEVTQNFRTRDTQTALAGQFQLVET
jgi:hypothetical protein